MFQNQPNCAYASDRIVFSRRLYCLYLSYDITCYFSLHINDITAKCCSGKVLTFKTAVCQSWQIKVFFRFWLMWKLDVFHYDAETFNKNCICSTSQWKLSVCQQTKFLWHQLNIFRVKMHSIKITFSIHFKYWKLISANQIKVKYSAVTLMYVTSSISY